MRVTLKNFYSTLSQSEKEEFKVRIAQTCDVSSRAVWYWIQGQLVPRPDKRKKIEVIVHSYPGRGNATIIYR